MSSDFRFRVIGALFTASCLYSHAATAADKLPALGADASQVSVSGLSSGAFMAVQYVVAYSKAVVGAGIIAGGPYYCAGGNPLNIGVCMGQSMWGGPDAQYMVQFAKDFATQGNIDPLTNLQNRKIYVFSGTNDTVVRQPAVDATVQFFKLVGVPDANLTYVNQLPAGHAFISPTHSNTNACATNASPYVNYCEVNNQLYDQAGTLLTFIYGQLSAPVEKPGGRVIAFDQGEFSSSFSAMAPQGLAYVPQYCSENPGCRVHVVFHGCLQTAGQVSTDMNYDNWADTNHMVILYPQVSPTKAPSGCWDWYGYTGQDYAWKKGYQLTAVHAMVDRLTSGR